MTAYIKEEKKNQLGNFFKNIIILSSGTHHAAKIANNFYNQSLI